MKFNPFRPNNIAGPGMFSGRLAELRTIERCLFQAKHGNPQHFLIEGERGIGKSSLLMYVELVASGQLTPLSTDKFNFLVVSTDLAQCDDFLDIVRTIGATLKSALSDREDIKNKAKAVWDFLSNWEVLGVRYHKEENKSADEIELTGHLVDLIARVINTAQGELDGVLILLDEADRPNEEANLGLFVKLLTERLTKKGVGQCLVGLAGLPTLIPKLRASHASSPRVFQTISLEPLEMEECKTVVQRGLEDANRKNPTQTSIDDDALTMVAHLSEGYPHFIQQFSYCAFDVDTNDIIGAGDVIHGAYEENGALAQLGNKYFNRMYFGQIRSDNYRRVLNAMANHGDAWVSRGQIVTESEIGEKNVDNALRALRDREIIALDDSRKGFYKLPTRSFAAWINAIKSVEDTTGADVQLNLDDDDA